MRGGSPPPIYNYFIIDSLTVSLTLFYFFLYCNMFAKPITLKESGNQFDTIRYMATIAKQSAKHPFFEKYIRANNMTGTTSDLQKFFYDVFYKTYYKKDPAGRQQIRSGTRLLREKFGNCVDYSVLFSAFLLNLGVPHSFRMISTNKNTPDQYSHIYVVTEDGIILDAVLNQDQDGNEYKKPKSKRKPLFNTQGQYFKKYDLKVL